MAVFGITIDKYAAQNPTFNNRYYVLQETIEGAIAIAQDIAVAEKTIFGETVAFVNAHAWLPGADPKVFMNQALSGPGQMAASNPIASWITAEVVWSTVSSYPSYKRYRTQLNSNALDGLEWTSSILTNLSAFVTLMNEFAGILCTRTGLVLGSASVTARYMPLQEGKRWYNRATEE